VPGVEPGDVPSLSQDELLGGLLDSLPDLFLGDVHDAAEVLAVVTGGDEHLHSGQEQVVDELLVLGDDGVVLDLDVVLLFEGGQVLGDDLVVPVLDLDFLSLDESLIDVISFAVSEYPSAPIWSHQAWLQGAPPKMHL